MSGLLALAPLGLTAEGYVTIGLAVVALVCYVGLALCRIASDHAGSRYLFLDALLAIAALEILSDTLGWDVLAWLCQGAIMAGGIALVVTALRRD